MSSKKLQVKETYDAMFKTGGWQGVYDLPYNRSHYYPMYKAVLKTLKEIGSNSILEVGCGTGTFATLLLEKTDIKYKGFDFSDVAIERARSKVNSDQLFYSADATEPESYQSHFDTVVCTEVLEHLEDDLNVIQNWPSGVQTVCTVPNYDSDYHVRFFDNEEQINKRYGDLIKFERIFRVKKPVITDIGIINRLRNLRWHRYNPSRIKDLMGLGDFEKVGGWFVMVGTKK